MCRNLSMDGGIILSSCMTFAAPARPCNNSLLFFWENLLNNLRMRVKGNEESFSALGLFNFPRRTFELRCQLLYAA